MKSWFLTKLSMIPVLIPTVGRGQTAELAAWAVLPQRQHSESVHNREHGTCKRETLDLCNVPANPALLVQAGPALLLPEFSRI